jgi:hypothetical protein
VMASAAMQAAAVLMTISVLPRNQTDTAFDG